MKKTAVILLNLGGPDSKESIRPFLFNFFMDPNIVRLPKPLRFLLAWRIAQKRSKNEAGRSYHELGDRSPLLKNSVAQAAALENALNNEGPGAYKVFVCMRYWHPMADQIVREMRGWGADEIILLPLYPQFSTTTTWSSLGVWKKAMKDAGDEREISVVCCYPFNEGFIKASAENIRAQIARAQESGHAHPRILFSAHGLPEMVVKDGDPYQWQCEQTAQKIVDLLNIENLDWKVCYQSRVGRLKWIGPSTEDEIRRAGAEGKALIIYPHAFTQEHVETLVELDIEYKHLADQAGVPGYYRAATVSVHPDFIAGLAKLVRTHQNSHQVKAEGGRMLCPENFRRCCMRSAA